MDTMEGAKQAIEETNEREFMGRNLRVNIAEQSGGKGRGGKGEALRQKRAAGSFFRKSICIRM